MTVPAGSLCEVTFETTLGARYVFPDVDLVEMEQLASFFPAHHSSLTISNVSKACLVVPIRVLQSFSINGVERWRREE